VVEKNILVFEGFFYNHLYRNSVIPEIIIKSGENAIITSHSFSCRIQETKGESRCRMMHPTAAPTVPDL
jgi:hypothetical protein